MKQFVKSAAIVAAFIITAFAQQSFAATHPLPYHTPFKTVAAKGDAFSIELDPQSEDQVIQLNIKNPGRKNLSITLNGPDGATLDLFFTGKKFSQMNKAYNFSDADSGIYTIEVTDGVEKIKKQIKLERVSVHAVNKLTVQ
jgi:hypothetical protein